MFSFNIIIVNCSLANLTDIPQLLPEKVTELSYESNNIQTIKSYVFVGKTSLLSLNLAHNNLTHFDNNTFCTIPNLEYLDLTHNPIILDNFDIFKCLEHLHVIILSHEQLKNQTNTLLPYPWNIYSTNQYLNLFRLSSNITTLSKRIISLYNFTNQLQINNNVKRERTANKEILTTNPFVAYSSSIVNQNLTTISNNSDRKRLSQPFLYKSYYSPTFDTTKCSDILTTISSINPISFIHQNQTIFFILFFLLILIMTCLILLLCLSYCTRKKLDMKRHHLNIELRSDHPIHHIPQTGDIRMYNTYYKKINQNQNNQDSLYEQLPSSSSDNSERQFLSSKNIYEKYELIGLVQQMGSIRKEELFERTENIQAYSTNFSSYKQLVDMVEYCEENIWLIHLIPNEKTSSVILAQNEWLNITRRLAIYGIKTGTFNCV
ncbi:unnamed protein product, partial [Didymodactylos carnosus]